MQKTMNLCHLAPFIASRLKIIYERVCARIYFDIFLKTIYCRNKIDHKVAIVFMGVGSGLFPPLFQV